MKQKFNAGFWLRLKFSAVVVLVTVGVMGGFGLVAVDHLKQTATDEAVAQLATTNRLVLDLMASGQEGMRVSAENLAVLLKAKLPGTFVLDQKHTLEHKGIPLPRLSLNGKLVTLDNRLVDGFTQETGGVVATVFAWSGDDFARVATSLKREDGSRAIGTLLGKFHPGYELLKQGKHYLGPVRLFGRYYMTHYQPVFNGDGQVVGALFVGLDMTPHLEGLRKKLRNIRIGGSGYVVVQDAATGPDQGTFLVHPAKEGQNPLNNPASQEGRFTRENIDQVHGLRFYEWKNTELGEQKAREKVMAYDIYQDLGWMVVSTGYIDEYTQTPIASRDYMFLATAVTATLLILVLNIAIGRLVLSPMIREISERKQAESSLRESESLLRESEERSRLLLEHSPAGILFYDPHLTVLYINRRFAQIMHVPYEHMIGLDLNTLKDTRVIPPQRDAIDGKVGRYEGPYETTYGHINLYISMYSAPVRNEAGEIIGGITILEDITVRTLAEQELSKYRDHLEELVNQRTAELEASRNEAERLSKVKSEFLANMSHEIRTPLNGVLGMAQIGYRNSEGRQKTRDTFARIIESGKLLLGVINDILDFSKLEAGKLQIDLAPVEIRRLLESAVDIVQDRMRLKGLTVTVKLAPDLPLRCQTDSLRVQQVLLNLLSNALKFTERGSVTLEAMRQGDRLVLKVVDTGIGMSQEQLSRVFTPFEQADTSTTRRFGGTGLGLTITQRIVDLLGGRISVVSQEGQGSCFEINLPFIDDEGADTRVVEGGSSPGTGVQRLRGYDILVAEDNDINRLIIEDALLDEGAGVTLVEDGRVAVEAVTSVAAGAFQVVLMDVQMPVMDGVEATREILRHCPDLPVIGQTAHALEEDRARCLGCGMKAVVTKPIDTELLIKTIVAFASPRKT